MKKFIGYFSIIFLLPVLINIKPCFDNLIKSDIFIKDTGTYYFYCLECANDLKGASVVKNGNAYIVKTSYKKAITIRKSLSNVLGESYTFYGDVVDFFGLQKKLELSYSIQENLDSGIITIYGYSAKKEFSNRSIEIDGKKINLQIAINDNVITIGNPIILGSY